MKYPVFLAIAYFLWIIGVVPYQTMMIILGLYLFYWLFNINDK